MENQELIQEIYNKKDNIFVNPLKLLESVKLKKMMNSENVNNIEINYVRNDILEFSIGETNIDQSNIIENE